MNEALVGNCALHSGICHCQIHKRRARRGNTASWELIKLTAADDIVTAGDLPSVSLKTFKGFCHIFTNCEQKVNLRTKAPPNWLGLMMVVCGNEEHFVSMVCWGAPKSERRTLFKPSAANWNMVEYVSFPVTLELSVLNTENKLFIYVIVS